MKAAIVSYHDEYISQVVCEDGAFSAQSVLKMKFAFTCYYVTLLLLSWS